MSYETAREDRGLGHVQDAARGVSLSSCVKLAFLAFRRTTAAPGMTWQTFADTFGLTARQGRLGPVGRLRGATRQAAAIALNISDHSAKADLKVVYERCGYRQRSGAGAGGGGG